MKILKMLFKKKQEKKENMAVSVEQVAERAFEQYKKTYKDLARYDRGEKILTN